MILEAGAEKRAIERLCRDLQLPAGDAFTQDWAHELPASFRTAEWLARYVRAYENASYGDLERRTLIQLALDAANDLLDRSEDAGAAAWQALVPIFSRHPELHRDQLEYWALEGDELEDTFPLTPRVRELVATLYGKPS
jgi:hypothetical protein